MSREQQGSGKEVPLDTWYVVCVTEGIELGTNLTVSEAGRRRDFHKRISGFKNHRVELRNRIDPRDLRKFPFSV